MLLNKTPKGKILKRGMATIEFYKKIKLIREAYENGYIVYKHLYRHIKEKYGLEMSYRTFLEYAKKEFDANCRKDRDKIENKKEQSNKSMEEYIKNMSHIFLKKGKK